MASSTTLRFDDVQDYSPPRLNVVWIENTLDCRTWTYYCDLKDAMSRMHNLCVPRNSNLCVDGRKGFTPQVIVAGPRYMANVAHADETLGFDRARYAHLPLAVVQNKMYAATAREIVGDTGSKLQWARDAGAVVGFTWLALAREFTERSGIPHYRMPFAVDAALYGQYAASLDSGLVQNIDIGFTGASNHKYPLREAILKLVRSMNVTSYLGTWAQTSLNVKDDNSWKALDRKGYVQQISRTKMWVSTTGPSEIVGTRYFEILASGTTLLLCNRASVGIYDGLLKDGVHAVIFDSMQDLRTKIMHYLSDEPARRRIVRAAADLTHRIHSWDARARFITKAFQWHIQQHDPQRPYYTPLPAPSTPLEPYVGCIHARLNEHMFTEIPARRPLRRFTVATCAVACQKYRAATFAVQCGGFCSGNGHRLARCHCAKPGMTPTSNSKSARLECATACSLRDSRPCGGFDSMAVFASLSNGSTGTLAVDHMQARRSAAAGKSRGLLKRRRGGGRGGRLVFNASQFHAAASE